MDRNIKLHQDHLETIVMLGQAADLTEKIDRAKSERDTAKDAYERQGAVYKEYCNASNAKSPKHYIRLLGDTLRGDDNWAGRDRRINSGRQNTTVKEDTYKKFVALKPSKSKTELIADYNVKLKEFDDARTGACPDCGNILFCTGENEISCCGRKLTALISQPEDSQHEMSKEHYITFMAYVACDKERIENKGN